MTPEEEKKAEERKRDYEWTLMESSQLPYPLNYLKFYNPGIAYVTTKVLKRAMEKGMRYP